MVEEIEYKVLSLDNAEAISEMTTLKIEAVLEMYRQNLYRGNREVYWSRDGRWFSMMVDEKFIHAGVVPGTYVIDDEVKTILEYHSRMKPPT